ncbi:MAG: TonB-dependent receptor [Candidatus Eremiobacteraeota bacterium]|nr:TonB-dependent receptor [Candidatus Eremiobacteraeota bacterium]
MHKALVAALALLCAAVALPLPAPAQSDSGEIRIHVVDAATKAPLELARVLLDGPVITSELTAKNGEVRFTDVPDGIYRARVVKRGYGSITSTAFEVLEGRAVTVSVALVLENGGLKTIGEVSVHASATISSTSITQDSAQRRLSDDLAGALNKLSGVSVQTSSDDSDATQTISLEGHDASQTQLTLDGIPLNAPGMAGNLRGFASDLFSGASVHMGPSLGGLGGSVNFTTLQPTLSWLTQASLTGASNGKYNYSLAESGSIDKLGLAVQTVYRAVPSLADGDYFLDSSGQAYDHDGDASYSGDLLKLRYQFSDSQALTGTFLSSARDTNLVCLRVYSPPALPCGYGPGNSSDSSVQLYALTDNALVGATQLQASLFSSTSTSLYDALGRTIAVSGPDASKAIAPSPAPLGYSTLGQVRGLTLNASLPARERHTISIQGYATSSKQATTPLVTESQPFYNGSFTSGYESLQITDAIRSNDKLQFAQSAGISAATGGGAGLLESTGITWRPTAQDTYSASYAIGGVAPTGAQSTILTDPTSLRFDCNGNVAYGNAPGQSPGRSSSTSARAGYAHAFTGGNVSLTLYRQVQSGVLLPVYVNGSEIESEFPYGYLEQVQSIYDSPGGCNAKPGTPFGAQQLYYQTPLSNVRRVYEGGSIAGYATLGNLIVQPYYDVNVSTAVANSPFVQSPYAITISGQQLPNVPLQKAGIVLDYKAPRSILEWLADAQYVGRNNPNNLPAYATFDAGVTARLTHGSLTFAASNLTDTYGGVFSGPQNAVPYTTLGGYTIGTTARPLTPRTYSVTYAVKMGAGASLLANGSPLAALPQRGGNGSGGGNGPGGGFSRLFSPLPEAPPPDPLAVVADPQRCSGESVAKASTLSAQLKAYVAQIESAKGSGTYPAAVAAPALTDATLTYHQLGATYAVSITPRGGGLRALAGCFAVHIARADDVAQRKLYAPSSPVFFVPQLTYMPSVGLYFVARQQPAGREQFRLYRLPATPPADPFSVRASDACSGQVQSLATTALADLKTHFAGGAEPAGWTIAAHTASKGTWYELQPGDPTLIPAILTCGRVAAATADEVSGLGLGGATIPALNYAPSLGLYVIRPQGTNRQ